MSEAAPPPPGPRGDRRRAQRRRDDRRDDGAADERSDRGEAPPAESWFGAIGVDTQWQGSAPASRFDGGWGLAPEATDSRFLSRQAQRIAGSGTTAVERLYNLFVAARAALGLALLLAQVTSGLLVARAPLAMLAVSAAYTAQAVLLWLLPRFRHRPGTGAARLTRRRWFATIGVDLLAFTVLHLLEPQSNLNYVALLVLPVLMGGVLLPRLPALGTASAVTLILLAIAWRNDLADRDLALSMAQTGLAGIGLFVVTLLAGELAGRLAREELTARGSLELARQQAQLNRLVIEEMVEGVLVADRRLRVRAANPAARRLLAVRGLGPAAPFALQSQPAWDALARAVAQGFEEGHWPEGGREVALAFDDASTRTLRLRARFTRRRPLAGEGGDSGSGESFCVLFMEDLRNVQARLRQEKLAAMGRVSAGIAHEIRNPLAAISQANALMQEDAASDEQRRLTGMVADNAERLKRIVDDVLEVAQGAPPAPRAVDASAQVAALAAEWATAAGVALEPGGRLALRLPSSPLPVMFDTEHLRRVLVNLLDNAHRHASDAPGAIELELRAARDAQARLLVASDGDPIPPQVERHLFEPFFSTRSRGTGLGLYICRELCERYGATIEYRLRRHAGGHRNEFQVLLRCAPVPADARTGQDAALASDDPTTA